MMFNEFDEAEYYIKDDDADGISLEDSEDSEICEDDCRVCLEPETRFVSHIRSQFFQQSFRFIHSLGAFLAHKLKALKDFPD